MQQELRIQLWKYPHSRDYAGQVVAYRLLVAELRWLREGVCTTSQEPSSPAPTLGYLLDPEGALAPLRPLERYLLLLSQESDLRSVGRRLGESAMTVWRWREQLRARYQQECLPG